MLLPSSSFSFFHVFHALKKRQICFRFFPMAHRSFSTDTRVPLSFSFGGLGGGLLVLEHRSLRSRAAPSFFFLRAWTILAPSSRLFSLCGPFFFSPRERSKTPWTSGFPRIRDCFSPFFSELTLLEFGELRARPKL